jgi:broad specificity phosphatase PhoE
VIRLFLLRHGNTFEADQTPTQVGARSDLPLTKQGHEQAKCFAEALVTQDLCPKAIYAGSLQRQIKTAQIVQEHITTKPSLHLHHSALTEIDYGPWEGLTTQEIVAKWPEEYKEWTEQAKWAEGIFGRSFEQHLEEAECFLDHLRKTYVSGDVVVAVTSNGVIRFFYALEKTKWQDLIEQRQMEQIKVKTGHFCELLIGPDSVKVVNWNQNGKKTI